MFDLNRYFYICTLPSSLLSVLVSIQLLLHYAQSHCQHQFNYSVIDSLEVQIYKLCYNQVL